MRIGFLYVALCIASIAVSVFAQVNILSNDITFRDATNLGQRTTHYGCMDIRGNVGGTGNVLNVVNESSANYGGAAVSGISNMVPFWGFGGSFEGGFCGVKGVALLSGTGGRYGGEFLASGSTSGMNWGVYCQGSDLAGYFAGSVYCAGTYQQPSDKKLKIHSKPLEGSLDKIMRLKPTEYEFDTLKYARLHLPSGKRRGLDAQDVELVFPEIVKNVVEPVIDKKDISNLLTFKSIDYTALIPVLIHAIRGRLISKIDFGGKAEGYFSGRYAIPRNSSGMYIVKATLGNTVISKKVVASVH